MFVLAPDSRHTSDLSYITRPNNDESSSSQWSQQEKICSMGSECMLVGSTGRYLFIDHGGRGLLPSDAGISSLGVKTFQHQRVCASENGIPQPRAYMNFPPPLSSPRLSSGIEEEILGQGSELLPTEGGGVGRGACGTAGGRRGRRRRGGRIRRRRRRGRGRQGTAGGGRSPAAARRGSAATPFPRRSTLRRWSRVAVSMRACLWSAAPLRRRRMGSSSLRPGETLAAA